MSHVVSAAARDEAGKAMREWMAVEAPMFVELADEFVRMGLTMSEARAFVAESRRAGSEWVTKATDERVCEQLSEAMGDRGGFRKVMRGDAYNVRLNVAMTAEQQAALRAEYRCVTDLEFVRPDDTLPAGHPPALCARKIARKLIFRMIARSKHVTEVGARPEIAVLSGVDPRNYFGVSPVLDAADIGRDGAAHGLIRVIARSRPGFSRYTEAQIHAAKTFVEQPEALFTDKMIQQVDRATDVIVGIDTNYGIPMSDMPSIMKRTGAKIWYGTLVRCPDAVIGSRDVRGHIPALGFDYETDRGRDLIRFSFRSPVKPYKHRLSIYAEYMKYSQREFVLEGRRYYYTALPLTVSSQLFFAMYDVGEAKSALSPVSYRPTHHEGYLRIKSWEVSVDGKKHTPLEFWVSEDQLTRAIEKRMIKRPNEPFHEVQRVIRGIRLGYIINGVRVSSDDPVAEQYLTPFVVAVDEICKQLFAIGATEEAGVRATLATTGVRYGTLGERATRFLKRVLMNKSTLVGQIVSGVRDWGNGYAYHVELERPPNFEAVDGTIVQLGGPAPPSVQNVNTCPCERLANIEERLREQNMPPQERASLAALAEGLRMNWSCTHRIDYEELWHDVATAIHGKRPESDCEDTCSEASGTFHTCASSHADETESTAPTTTCTTPDVPTPSTCDTVESDGPDESPCMDDWAEVVETAEQEYQRVTDDPWKLAVAEYADVQQARKRAILSEARELCTYVFFRQGVKASELEAKSDGRTTHHVLHVINGRVVNLIGKAPGVTMASFQVAYDWRTKTFVNVRAGREGVFVPPRSSTYLYTNSDMRIWNFDILANAADRALREWRLPYPFARNPIAFLNGYAGAGKTYLIRQNYQYGDLYLTSTAANRDDVARQLGLDAGVAKRFIRTYDSYARRPTGSLTGRMWMDEVPMTHFGEQVVVMNSEPEAEVYMFGDFFQVSVKPFVADYSFRYESAKAHCAVTFSNVQHRYGLQLSTAALRIYGDDSGLAMCTCHEWPQKRDDVFWIKKIADAEDVPLQRGWKIITFTQVDKLRMRSRLIEAGLDPDAVTTASEELAAVSCNTVAETQGGTYDRVLLVRLDVGIKPGSIFFSEEHVLVGLTRARYEVGYMTMSDEVDLVHECYEYSVMASKRAIVERNSRGKLPGFSFANGKIRRV